MYIRQMLFDNILDRQYSLTWLGRKVENKCEQEFKDIWKQQHHKKENEH